MVLNSVPYLAFVAVVFVIFSATVDHRRWLVLLLASYSLYATFHAPYLLVVLLAVSGIAYGCGLRIGSAVGDRARSRWFWSGCLACVLVLALFKLLGVLQSQGENTQLLGMSGMITAIGVSYFTFQAISYLSDIYLEIEEPERHFGYLALYLAFFPKLLQGPIERAGSLLPQLKQPYRFSYDGVRSGLLLFTCGVLKKVVLADRFSLYADQVYNNVHAYSGLPLALGTYAYALQIYFDFSGYTDMARGTARIFGIELTENFNAPYLATSISDFWRRWHISFSRWILDYIFKPLQMGWRDWGQRGTALALLVTFLVSGIWHGATWGFVLWGLLHGVYLAASTFYRPIQKKLHLRLGVKEQRWFKWWQVLVTFNLVCFAWIFFRAGALPDAWYVVGHLFSGLGGARELLLSAGKFNLVALAAGSLLILFVPKNYDKLFGYLDGSPLFRWGFYYLLLFMVLVFGRFGQSAFVYFKF